jgi:N-glycosylase/DNA lyase
MVENLCRHYGSLIASHDGVDYYDFPTPKQLSGPRVEEQLRSLGFGYRAKYIHRTAQAVSGNPAGLEQLVDLRNKPYLDAHEALLQFTGVGPKVADCVVSICDNFYHYSWAYMESISNQF